MGLSKPSLSLGVVVAVLFVAGCGSSSPSSSTSLASAEDDDEQIIFSNENVEQLVRSTDDYKGAAVDGLVGRAFSIERDGDTTGIQMWVDADQDEQVIVISDDPSIDVNEDDYVSVDGKVFDRFEGENALGAELTVSRIQATDIHMVDSTAMHPADDTLDLQTKVLGDLEYTISKIELADDQTRVYVEVRNRGSEDAEVDSAPSVVSDGRQMDQDFGGFADDLPELTSTLSPGAMTQGVLIYPRMDANDLAITFTGYDDNYDEVSAEFRYPEPTEAPPSRTDRDAGSPGTRDAGADQAARSPGLTACDANISVDAGHTTCPFAENTFYEYFQSGQAHSISVWSAALGRRVNLQCGTDGTVIDCSNNRGAFVEFRQAAVDAYNQRDARTFAESHDVG